jgi:glycosyltransferase involved in cell wall biosynthesis
LDLCEEDGRILLLAVIRRLKGQDSAIRAVSKLRKLGKRVTLYCVGKIVEQSYYEELRQLVAQEHLEDCVVFEEHAARSTVLEHYARAAVVVVPSLVENAPLVVSEAMSAGKAIVATPAGGIPEMIEDGRTGLIVPFEDPDAIADAVAQLLSDIDFRRKLGNAAKEAAEQRFRLSVSVRKTLEFYQHVLGIPLI